MDDFSGAASSLSFTSIRHVFNFHLDLAGAAGSLHRVAQRPPPSKQQKNLGAEGSPRHRAEAEALYVSCQRCTCSWILHDGFLNLLCQSRFLWGGHSMPTRGRWVRCIGSCLLSGFACCSLGFLQIRQQSCRSDAPFLFWGRFPHLIRTMGGWVFFRTTPPVREHRTVGALSGLWGPWRAYWPDRWHKPLLTSAFEPLKFWQQIDLQTSDRKC